MRDALASVCDEFETFARSKGWGLCYVCAADRIRTVLAQSPRHASVELAARPVWSPCSWSMVIQDRTSLRTQLHRLQIRESSSKTLAGIVHNQSIAGLRVLRHV